MEQIIGGFKEYIVIERKMLEVLENGYIKLSKINDAELRIRADEGLRLIEEIKENNIYNKDFKIKG